MIFNFRYFAQKALDLKLSTKAKLKKINVSASTVIGLKKSLVALSFLLLGSKNRHNNV